MASTSLKPDQITTEQAASPNLRIRIVGAGIAGLATALACCKAGFTNVVIYETVPEIAEVGAGIQVAPNQSRILRRLGVLDALAPSAVALKRNSLRRYANDEELGTASFAAIEDTYGAPLWVVHRADLQRVLLEGAKAAGVEIRTGSKVTDVDFEGTRVLVETDKGEQWEGGDVVVAADGIKSTVRSKLAGMHGIEDKGRATGDAAYRILIPREKLEDHPELLELVKGDLGIRWMGPGGHIMAYPIKDHSLYNMVLLHPDVNNTSESWTSKGSKSQMLDFYSEWNPLVQKLLAFVHEDDVMEWKLMDHEKLPSWVEEKTVLVGDACHPMLPYVAQGAAQAIEDGAVLAAALSAVEDLVQLPNALQLYQEVRKARAEAIQASAADTRIALHLPDGKKQEERDDKIRQAARGEGGNPDKWSDPAWQRFMWSTDVVVQTLERVHEIKTARQKHEEVPLPSGVVA